jgi:hypothetical protein
LAGKDPKKLQTLIRSVDNKGEETLAVIYASFQRIIKACYIYATDKVVGESALYKVNAVEYRKKVPNLFYIDIKDNTDITYQAVWLQILSYVIRAETD